MGARPVVTRVIPARLKVSWAGDYGAVAVEVDGTEHRVPGLHVYFFVAGFNYSGDRGVWCEVALYESVAAMTIRFVNVQEHDGGEDRSTTDFVSEDRGATWRRLSTPAPIDGQPVDTYDTNTLYWHERIARFTPGQE